MFAYVITNFPKILGAHFKFPGAGAQNRFYKVLLSIMPIPLYSILRYPCFPSDI